MVNRVRRSCLPLLRWLCQKRKAMILQGLGAPGNDRKDPLSPTEELPSVCQVAPIEEAPIHSTARLPLIS